MKTGCREKSIYSTISTISHKLSTTNVHNPILGIITTMLLLPALFSCDHDIVPAPSGVSDTTFVTKVQLAMPDDEEITGQIDIFAFESNGAGHLDSYQHMESFDGESIEFRSQNGEKHVFICANGQRDIYDWTGINSLESLGKIYLDLRKESRNAMCATAEGIINAGEGITYHMELRRMASEILLRSVSCDFSGTGYEGGTVTDVCVYLTNVNTQCVLTADGHIVPVGTVNPGGLDLEEVSCFKEPDMIYRKMSGEIGLSPTRTDMSFICYPNTSTRESPGTPFTRLVIEGKIGGETFWWPIDINRGEGTQEPGIRRNCRYVFDIRLTRKGNKDPDTPIGKEAADIVMGISPWNEQKEQRVPFHKAKISLPAEDDVNDINLIFFADGEVEERIWRDRIRSPDDLDFAVSLVKGREYTIAALANLGRELEIKDEAEWKEMTLEIKDGGAFQGKIPMSAMTEGIVWGENEDVRIEMERMAARISLRMDRSGLGEDVTMTARSVRIGNFPRYVSIMGPSRAESRYDVSELVCVLDGNQCSPLNTAGHKGLSGEASLYLPENMQGPEPDAETASFIEIEMDYLSSELISYDSPLIYRFYLTDNDGSHDIRRNCNYPVTLTPEGDGLSQTGWRIDKSGIGPVIPVFRMHPGEYVEGHVGDSLRIWCECYPRTAPFDPGYEELNFDKGRDIYDYRVDDDGHGVTLYLKKPGSGIVYMSAGEPINRSGMVLVKVIP